MHKYRCGKQSDWVGSSHWVNLDLTCSGNTCTHFWYKINQATWNQAMNLLGLTGWLELTRLFEQLDLDRGSHEKWDIISMHQQQDLTYNLIKSYNYHSD